MKIQQSLSNQLSTKPLFIRFVDQSVQVGVQVHILKIKLLFTKPIKKMKNVIFFLAALFSISVAMGQHQAHVIRVIDGDTFIAKWCNKNYTCRLENVDAPELSQNFGMESCRALSDLLVGHKIMITAHKVDLYGRRLVTVMADNKRVDSMLIRNGFAWLYVNYCHEVLLKQCMQDAIDTKLGLWQCGKEHVCAPWLYRHYDYRHKFNYCTGCK